MRRRPATQLTFDGLGMAGQPAPRSEPALPLPLEPWPAVPPRLEEPPPRPSEDVSVHDVVSAEDAVRGTDDASAQDELSRAIACALAGDVVLRAGAGTGKTYTLVEVVVRLCAGATEIGKRVPPSRILGLTFSEKAATELRERVRSRFEALAESPSEPALDRACAERDATQLTPAEWRAAAQALSSAPLSTFHSFAASLLRRHAPRAGVDPGFGLLDEAEAQAIRRECAEETVLGALGRTAVRALVRELGFAGGGDRGSGVVDAVLDVAARLAEEGRPPSALLEAIDDVSTAEHAFQDARAQVASALEQVGAVFVPGEKKTSARLAEIAASLITLIPAAQAALAELRPDEDPFAGPLGAVRDATRGNVGPSRREAVQALRAAEEALVAGHAAWKAAPLLAAFVDLVDGAVSAYAARKQTLGALDFGDLVARARDLLASDPLARAETRARYDAILVDEFQDTNDLQEAVVSLARGAEVPLLVVGDPKQSIYEFRGADVSVFGRVAGEVAERGGQVRALTTSRRGRAPLVEVVNRLFARALRGGEHAFQISFDPLADNLRAHRPGDGSAVRLLEGGDEPRALTAAIRELVDSGTPVGDGPASRPVRFGDMAVLLRRFSHLDDYLRELRRAGIPHYVVNGRGFFEAQEVRDLAHVLALLDDSDDALALFGVLRSPLVGLSDGSIVRLADLGPVRASGSPARLSLGPLLATGFVTSSVLPADEAVRLDSFLATYRRLRKHADRLGAGGVLRSWIDDCDLYAILAASWHGEQRIANLERLVALADAHDAEGRGDRRAFVRRLRVEIEREKSLASPAQILGEREDVVRVMTVHQSKGLEFPVVFVPECGAAETDRSSRVVYDRMAGLAMTVHVPSLDVRGASPRGRRAQELRRARSQAESLRLFYVAATRARDLLILSGRGRGDCWMRHVERLVDDDEDARALISRWPIGDGQGPAGAAAIAPSDRPGRLTLAGSPGIGEPVGRAGALATRIATLLAPPASGARTVVAPVTELADFEACPRRYRLRHELGMEEHPVPLEAMPRVAGSGAARSHGDGHEDGLDAQARGTLAHRLLERIDHAELRRRGPAVLDDLLALEGHPGRLDPGSDVGQVRTAVLAFLESPFGRSLLERPAASVLREVPFAFAAGEQDGPRLLLKGQMDLVLVDDDAVTIVDYKLARSESSRDYRFQLGAYGAAARGLFGRRVRVGLVHLLDRVPTPHVTDVEDVELDRVQSRLASIATALADAKRRATWPGRERPECEKIACGYVRRCHGNS